MKTYNHQRIEKKWQQEWAQKKAHVTKDKIAGKKNEMLLVEFPYPSGNLHVGHWYAFAVPDMYARMRRMQGKNVLYPIGFDAFGLPAENAAIKRGINPRTWTYKNIAHMRKQIESMGTSFDWSREVITCDPQYYKWTQWLFLQMYKKGLVYRKPTKANWCPSCKTVLANEQVVSGTCERCGTEVIQREMPQWNIRITEYADRLIDDLEPLAWPEAIKDSQRNWIGRSEGALLNFPMAGNNMKMHYVILHGYTSKADRPRFKWLKEGLEKHGHSVTIPQLPNTDSPIEAEQVATALAATTYTEKTIICGFSLGAVVALKVAEQLKNPIAGVVTCGGFCDTKFKDKEHRRFVDNGWKWKFNFTTIQANTSFRAVLHDVNDYAISREQSERLAVGMGVSVTEVHAKKSHFEGDTEPAVLTTILPHITVFSTRADTLYGATYVVLAPEHIWITQALKHKILENADEVSAYISKTKKKTELERQENKEKTGVKLLGVEAVNPATGSKIPVYIADYVLAGYGTGAVMAVPAHDERDHAFAKKYDIAITQVVEKEVSGDTPELYTGEGVLINSDICNGLSTDEGRKALTKTYGSTKKTYRLRDWIVSRQRYWGVPIPMIHCDTCGVQPVLEKQLPVELPRITDYLPSGEGQPPLAKNARFVKTVCPKCKKSAKRETDTLDTFIDSSWYFLRYTDPKNKQQFAGSKMQAHWMPVDLYSGGAEHTTMHLLYSRFWHKALFDMKLVKDKEPYVKRMNRGLILGPDGQKMSKSKGNVIDPDDVVERLGSDTVRLYLAFIGPYNEVGSYPWSQESIAGVRRFLERVWKLQFSLSTKVSEDTEYELHKAIKKCTEDMGEMKFNTAIAALMTLLNVAEKHGMTSAQYDIVLKLLAPLAPHITEELWHIRGHKKSIHQEGWPKWQEKKLVKSTVTIAIQVNGKLRGNHTCAPTATEAEITEAAKNVIAKWLEGQHVIKTIYIPGRLVNIVVKPH